MDNQRLILFIVFSFSLLMMWETWQEKNAPPAAPNVATDSAAPTPSAGGDKTVAAAAPNSAALADGQRARVETDLYTAEIDAHGGDLRDLQLRNYRESDDRKTVFTLFSDDQPALPYVAQTGLIGQDLPTHRSVFQMSAGTYKLAGGAAQVNVPLTWTDPATGVTVEKIWRFKRDSYRIEVDTRVINRGKAAISLSPYYQFTRHAEAPRGSSFFLHTFTGPAFYTDAKKFQKVDFKHIEEGKAEFEKSADNGWVGLIQHHFVAAWIPQQGVKRENYTRALGNGLYAAGEILDAGKLEPGQEKSFKVTLYAGPQTQTLLEQAAPGLDLARDYGWLTPIAFPIFWMLQKIEAVVGNWGWAIIILTIMLKAALFPLSAAGYRSMAKMRTLTPRLKQMQENFGDDRAKLHQAMAELYKTEKINPLGGCFPILIQIPVFIALYWVLLAAVEMRGAPWMGWITDLTAPDPFYILPVIMGVTSLLQVKLNPQPTDPMQAKIMMIMPVAFSVMFVFFPAGLVLYWVVNNILSIAQQWVVNRQIEGGGKAVKA